MIVYQAHNPISNKFYIGKTTKTLDVRRRQHEVTALRDDSGSIFHKALRKYGGDCFNWVTITPASDMDDLSAREMHWIGLLKECGHELYNMTAGGDGGSLPGELNHRYGSTVPREQREKISKGLLAHYKTHKGTMTGRTGELAPQYGKPISDEHRRRISAANKGRVRADLVGGNNHRAKPVTCITTGEHFSAASVAAKKYGIDNSSIGKNCRGQINNVQGYEFEYDDQEYMVGWQHRNSTLIYLRAKRLANLVS